MDSFGRINLLVIENNHAERITWENGEVVIANRSVSSISKIIQNINHYPPAAAWLFWDAALSQPDEKIVRKILLHPGDVWHAGLKLGLTGKPELIDFIQPTWMLNCDAPAQVASSSWRVSLRACLVKTAVLRQLGSPDPAFADLAGAGLDWGLSLLKSGVFLRYEPDLVAGGFHSEEVVSVSDQYRIVRHWSGRGWADWALGRAVMAGQISLSEAVRARQEYSTMSRSSLPGVRNFHQLDRSGSPIRGRVSVLIPTLQRYPYLRTLLDQIRHQTLPPEEIIVIDQTPPSERDLTLAKDFSDLPLKMIYLDKAGQCIARNAGLQVACGEYILFLDDDVEIGPDVIQQHLDTLHCFQADASAGTVHEPGTCNITSGKGILMMSSVFPTDNAMVVKKVLVKSGLFDLAYDHGARADGDLGMRLYLSGALLVQNLDIDLLHHHAPRGGLRVHKARVVTATRSRNSIFQRNIPAVTEFYLAKRYFTPRQVNSLQKILVLATFRGKGRGFMRAAKAVVSLLALPDTLIKFHRRSQAAEHMLAEFPQIPSLGSIERS